MNSRNLNLFLGAAVVFNLVVAVYLLATRGNVEKTAARPAPSRDAAEVRQLKQSVQGLRADVRALNEVILGSNSSGTPPANGEANEATRSAGGLSDRLAEIESSLARLQSAMDGISFEDASEERDELFRSEDGHLKADEYFEAGKFAIAGEGYLKFLESHPDHADARSILHRARKAFGKAGYADKAFWVQEEILKHFPEHRSEDLWTLAQMEKNGTRYADAAIHAAESAELLQGDTKYWRLLYAAWYAQLAHGDDAGLTYYRDVQQQITDAGFGDHRLAHSAQKKIDELQERMAKVGQ